jgi:hypothetical protein
MVIIASLESTKVALGLPVFTLDVNQVALKDPSQWTPSMQGLAPLEWNYFNTQQVELCVTPELQYEITGGQSLDALPWTAYQRFKKSQLFKSRPSGTTLSLTEQEASVLGNGVRGILWPTVPETGLTYKQRADVSELYFHTVANSTLSNAAFLTNDSDFLSKASDIQSELGVTVMAPTPAWMEYQPKFNLYVPSPTEIQEFLKEQRSHLLQLSTRSNL